MKVIRWADNNKKEILIEETKSIVERRKTTLENLQRDLKIAKQRAAEIQELINNLKAEIAEVKNALGIKEVSNGNQIQV